METRGLIARKTKNDVDILKANKRIAELEVIARNRLIARFDKEQMLSMLNQEELEEYKTLVGWCWNCDRKKQSLLECGKCGRSYCRSCTIFGDSDVSRPDLCTVCYHSWCQKGAEG